MIWKLIGGVIAAGAALVGVFFSGYEMGKETIPNPGTSKKSMSEACPEWSTRSYLISKSPDWRRQLEVALELTKPAPDQLFGVVSSTQRNDHYVHFWWCPSGTGPIWKVAHTSQRDWERLLDQHVQAKPIGFFSGPVPEKEWSLWFFVPDK